jgi:hypothetical protein
MEGVITTKVTQATTEGVTITAVTEATIEVIEATTITAATTGVTVTTEVTGTTTEVTATTEVTGTTTEIPATTGGLGSAIEGRWWWLRRLPGKTVLFSTGQIARSVLRERSMGGSPARPGRGPAPPRPVGAWGTPGDDRSFATAALRS